VQLTQTAVCRALNDNSRCSAWFVSEQIFKQRMVLRRGGDSLGNSVLVIAAGEEGLFGTL